MNFKWDRNAVLNNNNSAKKTTVRRPSKQQTYTPIDLTRPDDSMHIPNLIESLEERNEDLDIRKRLKKQKDEYNKQKALEKKQLSSAIDKIDPSFHKLPDSIRQTDDQYVNELYSRGQVKLGQDIPITTDDDDYGVGQWFNDAYGRFQQNRKLAEVKDYVGRNIRAGEYEELFKKYEQLESEKNKLDAVNEYLQAEDEYTKAQSDKSELGYDLRIKAFDRLKKATANMLKNYPNIQNMDSGSMYSIAAAEQDRLTKSYVEESYNRAVDNISYTGRGTLPFLSNLYRKFSAWIHDDEYENALETKNGKKVGRQVKEGDVLITKNETFGIDDITKYNLKSTDYTTVMYPFDNKPRVVLTKQGADKMNAQLKEEVVQHDYQRMFGDDVEEANRHLYGFRKMSQEQRAQAIQNVRNEIDQRRVVWEAARKQALDESKLYEKRNPISQHFKDKEQSREEGSNDFWSIDNWLYKQPGQLGFSTSAWKQQAIGAAAGMVAGFLSAGGSIGLASLVSGLSAATAIQAGVNENNNEVTENYGQKIITDLKNKYPNEELYKRFINEGKYYLGKDKSESEILEAFSNGEWHPTDGEVQRVLIDNTYGANKLFDKDMMAVAGDATSQFFINLLPIGATSKANKFGVFSQFNAAVAEKTGLASVARDLAPLGTELSETLVGRNVTNLSKKMGLVGDIEGTLAGSISKGSQYGSEVLGLGGGVVGGTLGAGYHATKWGITNGVKAISKTPMGHALAKATKEGIDMMQSFPGLMRTANVIKSGAIAVRNAITPSRLATMYGARVAKDFALRNVASMYSEGIEEGKQYLNAQDWINDKGEDQFTGVIENLYGDIMSGARCAPIAFLAPFNIEGKAWNGSITNPEFYTDHNLYENVVGGELGGLGHNLGMSILPTAATMYKDITLANAVQNNIAMDKLEIHDKYDKGQVYARIAATKGVGTLMKMFDDFSSMQKQRSERGLDSVPTEAIDDQKQFAMEVALAATSPYTKQQAKKNGIKENTPEYYQWVAADVMYTHRRDTDIQARREALQHADKIAAQSLQKREREQEEMQEMFQNNENVDEQQSNTLLDKIKKRTFINDVFNKFVETVEGVKKDLNPIRTAQEQLKTLARISALQDLINSYEDSDEHLGRVRERTFATNLLKQQLNDLKKSLKIGTREDVLNNIEDYVDDAEAFAELKRTYRDIALYDVDLKTDDEVLRKLDGIEEKSEDGETTYTPSKHKDILNKLNSVKQKDSKLLEEIDKQHQKQWMEDKLGKPVDLTFEADTDESIYGTDQTLVETEDISDHTGYTKKQDLSKETKQQIKAEESVDKVYDNADKAVKTKGNKKGQQFVINGLSDISVSDEDITIIENEDKLRHLTVTKVDKDGHILEAVDQNGMIVIHNGQLTTYKQQQMHSRNNRSNNDEQQQTLDRLEQIRKENDKKIKRNKSTYHDIFVVDEQGNEHMYMSAEYAAGEQYIPSTSSQQMYDEIKRTLTQDVQNNDIASFTEHVKQYAKRWNDQFSITNARDLKLSQYVEYYKKNPDQAPQVIEAIAKLASEGSSTFGLTVSKIAHEAAKHYFSQDINDIKKLVYDTFTFRTENGKDILVSQYMSKDVWDEMIDSFDRLYSEYQKEGFKLMANPITFFGTFTTKKGNAISIAAQPDIIAVDKQGNIHIIDLRTSKWSFQDNVVSLTGEVIVSKFDTLVHTEINGKKMLRTDKHHSSRVMSVQLKVVENALPGKIATDPLEVLPLRVVYEEPLPALPTPGNRIGSVKNEPAVGRYTDIDVQDDIYNYYNKSSEKQTRINEVLRRKAHLLQQVNQILSNIQEYKNRLPSDNNTIFNEIHRTIQSIVSNIESIQLDSSSPASLITKYEQDLNAFTTEVYNNEKIVEQIYAQNINLFTQDNRQQETQQINGLFETISQIVQKYRTTDQKVTTEDRNKVQQLLDVFNPLVQEFRQKYGNDSINSSVDDLILWWNDRVNKGPVPYNPNRSSAAKNTSRMYNQFDLADVSTVTAIDDQTKKLSDVITIPDFTTKGVFELFVIDDNIYCQVTYNGITYNKVRITPSTTEEGIIWKNRVIDMWNNKTEDEHIYATKLSRTKGVAKLAKDANGQYVKKTLMQAGLVKESDLYNVEITPQQLQFGLCKNGSKGIGIYAGNDLIYKPDTENEKKGMYPGMYYYILECKYNNYDKELSRKYPLILNPMKLEGDNLEFVIDCLTGFGSMNALSQEYEVVYKVDSIEGGSSYRSDNIQGLRYLDLLSMFIPYGVAKPGNTGLHVQITQEGIVFTKMQKGQLVRAIDPIDISKPEDVQRMRTFLSGIKVNIDVNFVNKRLGQNKTLEGVKQFFRLHPDVNEIKIDKTDIVFHRSDFQNPANKADQNGLTGLGWFIKNKFLFTSFDGMQDCLISAQGVSKDSDNKEEQSTVKTTNEPAPIVEESSLDYIQKGLAKKTISIEKAKAYLRKILGNVPVEIANGLIDVYANNKGWVVGRTYTSRIALSKMAEEGTEYHEGFHWALELSLPKFLRNAAYSIANKTMEKFGLKHDTDTERAEWLAEMFRKYKLEKPEYKWNGTLKRVFENISKWHNHIQSIGGYRLYALYIAVNNGLAKYFKVTDKDRQAFIERHKKVYLDKRKIHGVEFETILDKKMYKAAIRCIALRLIENSRLDSMGSNITDLKADITALDAPVWDKTRQQYDTEYASVREFMTKKGTDIGNAVMQELFDHWDVVEEDVRDYISEMATNYHIKYELENDENKDGDERSMNNADGIEEHVKASYEFSRFESTTAQVRFMLSTIIRQKVVHEPNGVLKIVGDKNPELGFHEYMDVKEVFNVILSDLHEIQSKQELFEELKTRATYDPMYKQIYAIMQQYQEAGKTNATAQMLVTQIYNTIRSNKNNFKLCKATRGEDNLYTVRIIDGNEYEARNYRSEWSMLLANGASPLIITKDENGRSVFNTSGAYYASVIYTRLADIEREFQTANIDDIRYKGKGELKIKNNVYNVLNPTDLEQVKTEFIKCLNLLGIQFTKGAFDYLLMKEYHSKDLYAMQQFFTNSNNFKKVSNLWSTDAIGQSNGLVKQGADGKWYINFNQASGTIPGSRINKDGVRVTENIPIDKIYDGNAFAGYLSDWYYRYRHDHDELTVLATKGNKFYVISDNNLVSDVTADLNTNQGLIDRLKQYGYVYQQSDDNQIGIGSQIVKHYLSQQDPNSDAQTPQSTKIKDKIEVCTISGFKTNKHDDEGSDYFEMTKREDYIAKATILQEGYIMFPTLSDKKTWMFLKGIKLKGIDYQASDVKDMGIFTNGLNYTTMQWNNDVVNQMIEYVTCEYNNARDVLEKIKTMNDEDMIANYHKGFIPEFKKPDGSVVYGERLANGATLGSLTGIYKINDQGVEEFISFTDCFDKNGNFISQEENLRTAYREFFSKSADEQAELMRRVLQKGLEEEIEHCIKLGIIEVKDKGKHDAAVFAGLENKGFDKDRIKAIKKYLNTAYSGWNQDDLNSLALSILIADTHVKALQSIQEVERVYSGHPGFFKYAYDNQGHLVDRQTDEFKRFGGLGSTGVNNDLELDDIPEKWLDENGEFTGEYVCAELKDVNVQSDQYELLKERIEYSAIYRAYERYKTGRLEEVKEDLTVEQMRAELPASVLITVDKIIADETKSYENKINVADGAAYITDDMCEMLLRMVGKWDEDVKRAFKILRGEDWIDEKGVKHSKTNVKAREYADAYHNVITTVIGTQKYTAYGLRKGSDGSTCIPYYNKMALFPIFKCIATGEMAQVYDMMKDPNNGIDMLLFESAVKIGQQGAQHWSPDMKPIKYKQEFKYLRKQLNTDPKEGHDERGLGTQMSKVVFAGLSKSRTYHLHDGQNKTGQELVDKIMGHINDLSDIGVQKIEKLLFDISYEEQEELYEDENGVQQTRKVKVKNRKINQKKLSEFLQRNLQSRDADDNILEAIGFNEETKEMVMKLAATSNASWIESILNSKINSEVIDINTPGTAFVQRSVFGMEGPATVLTDENYGGTINNGNPLKTVNEDGSMDCVLSIDFFYPLLKQIKIGMRRMEIKKDKWGRKVQKKDENGNLVFKEEWVKSTKYGVETQTLKQIPVYEEVEVTKTLYDLTFEEQVAWLRNKGIIGGKANIIGYRIPTQAQSSIHALRCVDVLPAVRDTVILPKDFTKITGSDFDIDKLYLATINYDTEEVVDNNNHVHTKIVVDNNNIPVIRKEKDPEKYAQNEIILSYLDILKDTDNNGVVRSADIHLRSIDNDTSLPQDIAEGIRKQRAKNAASASNTSVKPMSFYTLKNQSDTKNSYITGKIGIGPFALNNNNQILTMLYNVEFSKDSFMTKLGHGSLHRDTDDEGNSILSWISALINAHVDIAKDPWVTDLNVNPFTYNLTNLMVRTGFGSKTFYFLKQPIMERMAQAFMNAQGSFLSDPYKNKYQMQNEAVQKVYEEMIPEEVRKRVEDSYKKDPITLKSKYSLANQFSRLIESDAFKQIAYNDIRPENMNQLIEIGRFKKVEKDKNGNDQYYDLKLTGYEIQAIVYLAYKELSTPAQALADLVKYSKIDTKKQGKTIAEQRAFEKGVIDTFVNEMAPTRRQFNHNVYEMYDKSYIRHKTENALSLFRDVLSGQLFEASQFMEVNVTTLNDMAGHAKDPISAKFMQKAHSSIITSLYADFWNQYAKEHNVDLLGLVSGPNAMAHRLNRLKVKFTTQDDLIKKYTVEGEIRNAFLKLLIKNNSEYNSPLQDAANVETAANLVFVRLFNQLDLSSSNRDLIIQGWDDILNDDENQELQEFARDMVLYAYLTSGNYFGASKLFKYVPNSFRLNEICQMYNCSFATYIDNLLNQWNNPRNTLVDETRLEDVLLNNWDDNQFIPIKKLSDNTGEMFRPFGRMGDIALGLIDVGDAVVNDPKGKLGDYTHPLFIKVKGPNNGVEGCARQFIIYKRFGYYYDESNVKRPIYIKHNPKGMKYMRNDVFQYGDCGFQSPDHAANPEDLTRLIAQILHDSKSSEEARRRLESLKMDNLLPYLDSAVDNWEDAIQKREFISRLLDRLGGDPTIINIFDDTMNVYDKGISFQSELKNVTPWFTEDEAREIMTAAKNSSNGKLTVVSMSRKTDPVFFSAEIIEMLKENSKKSFSDPTRVNVVEIWTKHDGEPLQDILDACKKYKVAPMVSFSITGMGNTSLEPGVLSYEDMLDRVELLIKNGDLDPRTTTIRIDPILPGVTNMDVFDKIIERGKSLGIRKYVTSLMQSYGYKVGTSDDRKVISGINEAFARDGMPTYDWEKYYGIITQEDFDRWCEFERQYEQEHPDAKYGEIVKAGAELGIRQCTKSSIGKIHHIPKNEVINEIAKTILKHVADPSIVLESCSFTMQGVKPSACLDPTIMEAVLGASIKNEFGRYDVDQTRPECACYGAHGDFFDVNSSEIKCFSSCAYCYAAHSDDNNLHYYRSDGSIVDSKYSRVRTDNIQFDLKKALTEYDKYLSGLDESPVFAAQHHVNDGESTIVTTVKQALEDIINTSSNQQYVQTATELLQYVQRINTPVEFTSSNGERIVGSKRYFATGSNDWSASSSGVEQRITINTNSPGYFNHSEKSMLHETTHSLTSVAIVILENRGVDLGLNKYIEYIKDEIRKVDPSYITNESIYAFHTNREFIAEFYSNIQFQNILKNIPAMEQDRFNNMFEQVVDWIRKVMSYISGTPQNAYDQILPILEGIVELEQNIDFNRHPDYSLDEIKNWSDKEELDVDQFKEDLNNLGNEVMKHCGY